MRHFLLILAFVIAVLLGNPEVTRANLTAAQTPMVQIAEWNADGTLLGVVLGAATMQFRDEANQVLYEIDLPAEPWFTALAWHPIDPALFAITYRAGRVSGWRFTGSAVEPVFTIETGQESVFNVRWNRDGSLLGIYSTDSLGARANEGIQIWQWNPTVLLSRITLPEPFSLSRNFAWDAVTPDSLYVIGVGNEVGAYYGRWSATTASEFWGVEMPGHGIHDIAVKPDGQFIAVSLGNAETTTIRVADATTGNQASAMRVGLFTSDIAWYPDRYLAVELYPARIGLWDGHSALWDAVVSVPEGWHDMEWFSRRRLTGIADGEVVTITAPVVSHPNIPPACEASAQGFPPETVQKMAWRPDGGLVAVASLSSKVDVLSATADATLYWLSPLQGYPVGIAWSPDGRRLAVASSDAKVYVWNVSHRITFSFELDLGDAATTLFWSLDGSKLVTNTSGTDRPAKMRIWDVQTGALIAEKDNGGTFDGEYNPSGTLLALLTASEIVLVDTTTFDVVERIPFSQLGDLDSPTSVTWTPSGSQLIVGFFNGAVVIYDLEVDQIATSLPPRGDLGESAIFDAVVNSAGTVAAVMARDGILREFDIETGEILKQEVVACQIADAEFSPDGARLILGELATPAPIVINMFDADLPVAITFADQSVNEVPACDATTQEYVRENVVELAWSPDGSLVAVASLNTRVSLLDTRQGTVVRELWLPRGWVANFAWSPDGQALAAASFDAKVYVWEVQTGALRFVLDQSDQGEYATTLLWTPDGTKLVTNTTGTDVRAEMRLWDAHTGALIARRDNGGTGGGKFSPSGALLATSAATAVLLLDGTSFDLVERIPLLELGEMYFPADLAWTPSDSRLIVGFANGAAIVYDLDADQIVVSLPPRSRRDDSTIIDVAIDATGTTAVAISRDGMLVEFDLATGVVLSEKAVTCHIVNAAFSPDGARLIVGERGEREAIIIETFSTDPGGRSVLPTRVSSSMLD